MKIGYSQISLLLFVIAIVLKAISVFAFESVFLTVGFFAAVVIGIVLIGAETYGQKKFADAFVFENKFRISFFSILASVGFFVDFVSDSLELYSVVQDGGYNVAVGASVIGFEGLFALVSAACMIMVSLSFGKNTRYDFRELKILNIFPLLWAILKGIALLSDIGQSFSQTEAVKYIAVISCIVAFYFFAKEVDGKDGASACSVFSFRCFAYFAVLYFICILCDVLTKQTEAFDRSFVLSLSILLNGVFAYFLEKNILSHTKID
mgnify:FL=1